MGLAGRRPGRHAHLVLAIAALVLLFGTGAAPAGASTGRLYFGHFGSDGTEDPESVFENRTLQMDFDQSSNDLLVIEKLLNGDECLDRFHTTEAGLPARPKGFPAAAGGQLCGIAANLEDIAVDNTGAGTQGRIYVAGFEPGSIKVFGFDSNGTPLGGNFPLTLASVPNTVAVDSLGNLWVGINSAILEYDSSGNLLGEPVKPPSAATDLAFDSEDNLFADLSAIGSSRVVRYAKSGGYMDSEEIDPGNPLRVSGVMTIDPSDDHLFVRRSGDSNTREIDEYDVSGLGPVYPQVPGSPFSGSEDLTSTQGMAVDEGNHILYIGVLGPPTAIHAFGSYGTHPEVSTGATSTVTNSAATLNGAVDPENTETQCHFEYGPTDAYGTSVPCASGPGSGKGAVEVHADIAGLKASSVYHYRLVAENSIGPVVGEDALLTTFGPPAISDTGFDSATSTTANVSAKINPANQISTYRVEYTPQAAYEANTPADEHQQLKVGASSGTFKLSYEGQQTSSLEFNVSAGELKEALEGLSSIGDVGGTVTVSGGPGDAGATNPYEIVFGGSLGGEDVPQIEADGADLEGGTGAEVQGTTAGHSRFDGASVVPVPDGSLPEGTADVTVKETIGGLSPDSSYRYRVLAKNISGTSRGPALALATYPPEPPQTNCPNQAFRSGPGAILPDCRAYEPLSGDLHGLVPQEVLLGIGGAFGTELASPDGGSVIFGTSGGSLPGSEGNGTNNRYEAVRGPGGWSRRLVSPSGEQATITFGGGLSPDHGYSVWRVEPCCGGSLSNPLHNEHYLRRPDGSFELVGQGEPGFESDPQAQTLWISPNGGHVVFRSNSESGGARPPLAPGAPTGNTVAIYDRTPTGLHVVSLLPEEVPLNPGEGAEYQGASADGSAVAFKVEGKAPLYLRLDNAQTLQVLAAANTFAGLSANGDRLFYLKNGDIVSYDTTTETPTPVTAKAEATVVNVSADGSHLYFVSAKVLDEAEEGTLGANNLYVWDEASGQTRFIADLDPTDLSGPVSLGRWVSDALSNGTSQNFGPGNDPSQATPDGSAFIFESHAQLSGYDNQGHSEVYRYDSATHGLACLSCSPVGTRPRSDARLRARYPIGPINPLALIHNISDDGQRAFFETGDGLVAADTDGVTDVYEWEAQGKGSCEDPAGCVYLISGGKGTIEQQGAFAGNFLYAATPDGSDVFIRSNDVLVPASGEGGAATIYDARAGGGFSYPSPPIPCQGDSCKGQPTSSPGSRGAGSAVFSGPGNPKAKASSCPKGKRAVRKAGKSRCVKRKAKHSRHNNRKGALR